MNKSESIAELAKALSVAQAKMTFAEKSSTNPHFKSRYADLAAVLDAVRAPLASAGLSVTQLVSAEGDLVSVETVLLHSSGEWISSVLAIPAARHDAQGVGSAVTYARRYSLAAICGIAQDDDDGEAAARSAPRAPSAPGHRSQEQTDEIARLLAALGVPPGAQADKVQALAGDDSPRSATGAVRVIERLRDELETRVKA